MKYILDERYRLRGWQGAPTGLFDTKRKAPAFLFRLVKEFKDTLGCGRHSLEHVADLGKLGNGLGKTFHILNK